MEKKITKREMYEAMMKHFNGEETDFTTEEMACFCENEIKTLAKRSEKSKERASSKRAVEADNLTNLIKQALTEDYQTIGDIAAVVAESDPECTAAKVQYRLNKLVEAGGVEKTDLVIAGTEGGKARRVKGFRIAGDEVPVEDIARDAE